MAAKKLLSKFLISNPEEAAPSVVPARDSPPHRPPPQLAYLPNTTLTPTTSLDGDKLTERAPTSVVMYTDVFILFHYQSPL